MEDLLECCLADVVFLDSETMLLMLKLSEEPSNRLFFLRNAKFEELTALFQHFDLLEVTAHPVDDLEAGILCAKVFEQVPETNLLALRIKFRF